MNDEFVNPFYLPQPGAFEKKIPEAVVNPDAQPLKKRVELAVKLFSFFVKVRKDDGLFVDCSNLLGNSKNRLDRKSVV